jgi:hypothetical protein
MIHPTLLIFARYREKLPGTICQLGRPHARGGLIKTEKNGVEVPVIILPILQTTLDAGPCGDLTFIVGENGRPLTKESFGKQFKAACKAAGVPGSAHGVRKRAATRMADNGATEAQPWRCLVGLMPRWRRITPAPPTDADLPPSRSAN